MPFYELNELERRQSPTNSKIEAGAVPGEFMKFGIVTKPEGEGPPLHEHPNEEQFTLVLEGKLHMILGDEDCIVERGDLIHIPRFTPHRSRAVGGAAVFFTVKYPAGSGDLGATNVAKSRLLRRGRKEVCISINHLDLKGYEETCHA